MIDLTVVLDLVVLAALSVAPLVVAVWLCLCGPPVSGADPRPEEQAAALLRHVLSDEERWQLERDTYLAVSSPSSPDRVYRVPAQKGWVEVYDSGRLTMKVCVEPVEPLPPSDVVLMHKLLIEGDEVDYLRRANVWCDARIFPSRRRRLIQFW